MDFASDLASDLYAVLGVTIQATPDEIRRAYRQLALACHPDRNPAPEATQLFVQIQRAYEVLSDAQLRAEYDLLDHVLYQLQLEEYLQRYEDLTLTAQGLQLPVGLSSCFALEQAPMGLAGAPR